ncbi:MAG: hypothetical protein ACWA44_07050 [Thiotrichales bacterium]
MKISTLAKTLVMTSAVFSVSSALHAATQGELGATSTGIVNINVGIGDQVRISNLQDISGTFDGVNDIAGQSAACVYRNGTGNYSITATGSGANGAFEITDGVNSVPFAVSYNDGSGDQSFASGVQLAGMTGADIMSPTCANTGDNGTISVVVGAADLAAVPGSTYSGSVTLLVAPE